MFTIYLLYSETFDKIYIGYTSNLSERLKSHNELGTKGYTLKYRPWTLIYTEVLADKQSSLRREKELKSSRGRAFCWGKVAEFKAK